MKSKLLAGTATLALSVAISSHPGSAATLDDVLHRLDKLEKENSELRREVNTLREHRAAPAVVAPAAAPASASFKGNPVYHGGVAPSPGPAPLLSVGGKPVFTKAPGGALVDNTTVTIYGHVDVSGDIFNPSVYDQGTKWGIASNGSYFGIRARHNLAPYGYPGFAVLAQFEEQVDVAAAPTERAAFGTRDSYVGLEGPWGAIKGGKSDTPYKKITAAFDPFANTLADYNSIMGNTGGDNRAEFDWRMNHAIWYESPVFKGFQFSALVSPGQNYAPDNSDYSYGDYFQCNGASTRGSGSNFPNTGGAVPGALGGNGCTDGSFGNAYSAAASYKNGPLTLIAAGELHQGVNRHGDDGLEPGMIAPVFLPDGSQVMTGIADEWAAKIGGGYRFTDPLGPLQFYGFYEWIRREVPTSFQPFNERSRDGWFASATQSVGEHLSFSASWAHAGRTPGNPAVLCFNNLADCTAGGTLQANLFDDSANMYAAGARYRFNNWASVYVVGSVLTQGPGAHYCLGPSGHGYAICSRDQFNDTIGGATIKAVSTGMTFDF